MFLFADYGIIFAWLFAVPVCSFIILSFLWLIQIIYKKASGKNKQGPLEKGLSEERSKRNQERYRLYELGDQYVSFSVKGFARGGAVPKKQLATASLNEIRAGLVVFLLDLLSDSEAPHKKRLEAIKGAKSLYEGIPYGNALRNDNPLEMEESRSAIWSFVVWADLMEIIQSQEVGFCVDEEKVHQTIVKRLLIGITESE